MSAAAPCSSCRPRPGIASGNPKTFVVAFLTAWYVAINDNGLHPWMDFGAFHPSTPWTIALGHATFALVLAAGTDAAHRVRLRQG